MDRGSELAVLRAAIKAVPKRERMTRYPQSLRRRIVEFVERGKREGILASRSCMELGMRADRVRTWRQKPLEEEPGPLALHKVSIVQAEAECSTLVVHGPAGIRVHGLSMAELAELIRRLA